MELVESNVLGKYLNGNVSVTLYNDGTKVMEYDDEKPVIFDFPTSMDVKITNWCQGVPDAYSGEIKPCQFCHERSGLNGKHGDMDKLLNVLSYLPGGQEIAIGGGNPLGHPDLKYFLERCKNKGIIPNLTVNKAHLSDYDALLRSLIKEKLIYGLGISIPPYATYDTWTKDELYYANYEHTVAHLILGLHNPSNMNELVSIGFKKFLLLGYKIFGRGKTFYKQNKEIVDINIDIWNKNIIKIIMKNHVSFDNLAIEQLNMQKRLPKTIWDKLYQGDDFSHTMYVDAVNEEYAPTSRSDKSERVKWNKMNLLEYFKINKKNFKNA